MKGPSAEGIDCKVFRQYGRLSTVSTVVLTDTGSPRWV